MHTASYSSIQERLTASRLTPHGKDVELSADMVQVARHSFSYGL